MSELVEELRRAGVADVDDGQLRRSLYSTDASLYRIAPLAVVVPASTSTRSLPRWRSRRELGVPLTSRGAGTSIAGNAVGRGIVLDFSRHLNRVLTIDPDARTARGRARGRARVLQQAACRRTACASAPTRRRTTAARSAA